MNTSDNPIQGLTDNRRVAAIGDGSAGLMAGKGGMNITHAEPFDVSLTRYGTRHKEMEPLLRAFPLEALRE